MRLYEVFCKPKGDEWHTTRFIGLYAAQGEEWACLEALDDKFKGVCPSDITVYAARWHGGRAPHVDGEPLFSRWG